MINPSFLVEDELLRRDDLIDRPEFPLDAVQYGNIIPWKMQLLGRAYERFQKTSSGELHDAFPAFCEAEKYWLEDFSLFMAIKDTMGGGGWSNWPDPLKKRQKEAIEAFKKDYGDRITRYSFFQFLFFRQWEAVRDYARKKDIEIIGDIPIFVAFDSADAWANPDLFYMDEDLNLTVVAGVPPDYFSPTGQLWGNPLYRWGHHKKTGYQWWMERLRATYRLYDIIRLDHFRGFAGYWEIPAGNETAEIGRWVPGPGADFFNHIQQEMGELPIIAEDLGEITPDVIELRDDFGFPGMKILQFAFASDPSDPFLPHNYPENCVAYTGTHDNDTTRGWYANSSTEEERKFSLRYLRTNANDFVWDMIRTVWMSTAAFAISPMQDFLNKGSEARMNFPGKLGGNWSWRIRSGDLNDQLGASIAELNYLYSRTTLKGDQEENSTNS